MTECFINIARQSIAVIFIRLKLHCIWYTSITTRQKYDTRKCMLIQDRRANLSVGNFRSDLTFDLVKILLN